MVELEKEIKQEEKIVKRFFSSKSNIWMTLSVVLAVALILSFIFPLTMSKDKAGNTLVNFLNTQVVQGGGVTLKDVQDKGDLFLVNVLYQGQEIPVYLTKDGNYFIQSATPIKTTTTNTNTNTNSNTNTQTPTNVPKTAKPKVELFVMAYCPYGTQNEKGLIPVMNLLKDKADFEIKFVYYAMHGQKEVDENTRQYCIQKEQTTKFVPYLTCFLNASDSPGCLASTGIDTTKLNACVAAADTQFDITKNYNDKASWLSGQFPLYNVNKAENEAYNVAGSPTMIVNGVQVSGRAPADVLKAVCSGFTTQPSECSQKLDTATPSAGFGYSASAAGSTNAQCG